MYIQLSRICVQLGKNCDKINYNKIRKFVIKLIITKYLKDSKYDRDIYANVENKIPPLTYLPDAICLHDLSERQF